MSERNLRKTRVGMVVSDKMDKTVVVAIQDNGFIHFVTYNHTYSGLTKVSFAHLALPP